MSLPEGVEISHSLMITTQPTLGGCFHVAFTCRYKNKTWWVVSRIDPIGQDFQWTTSEEFARETFPKTSFVDRYPYLKFE